jgi:hypothetical protein
LDARVVAGAAHRSDHESVRYRPQRRGSAAALARHASGASDQIQTRRIGSFWLDVFNLHREVVYAGWTFSALTVFVDDLVVYALAGGQPRIDEKQTTKNPVGPLHGLGGALPMPAP